MHSVYGQGDKETLKLLKEERISGRWLNLGAGDGRYNNILLEKANSVLAADIDKKELELLIKNTPKEYMPKLRTKVLDLAKKLPFEESSFDGVFCTGTLHFFKEPELKKIISEIQRILKPEGTLIIDFATDIKRVKKDGQLYVLENEPKYELEQAWEMLSELLKNFETKFYKGHVSEETVRQQGTEYKFSCSFILAKGIKL